MEYNKIRYLELLKQIGSLKDKDMRYVEKI